MQPTNQITKFNGTTRAEALEYVEALGADNRELLRVSLENCELAGLNTMLAQFMLMVLTTRTKYDREQEPFYCPDCGTGGADHTESEYDCEGNIKGVEE